jgi:hypothetical protein
LEVGTDIRAKAPSGHTAVALDLSIFLRSWFITMRRFSVSVAVVRSPDGLQQLLVRKRLTLLDDEKPQDIEFFGITTYCTTNERLSLKVSCC